MSVLTQIGRIKSNVSSAYDAIATKGVAVSGDENSDYLAAFILQISTGINYAKGHSLTIRLPQSGWIASGGTYQQTVVADVTAANGIAQILLSEDVDTRLSEMAADEALEKVELFDGSIKAVMSELPEVDLILSISTVDGLTASSKAALMRLDSAGLTFTLHANAWSVSNDGYIQTVAIDGMTDCIVFGDLLADDDDDIAAAEMFEARKVSKFEPNNGSITAVCYGYPPEIDLTFYIKCFEE